MIVTTRKRIGISLICHGYTEDACMIVHQESRFVNAAVFDYWAETILFPEISRRRVQYNYKGEVLLLLDGCTSHFSDFFLDECTYYNIFPFQEPPGSSDQLQVLDLGIFDAQKAYKRSFSKNCTCSSSISRRIRKNYTSKNVLTLFKIFFSCFFDFFESKIIDSGKKKFASRCIFIR